MSAPRTNLGGAPAQPARRAAGLALAVMLGAPLVGCANSPDKPAAGATAPASSSASGSSSVPAESPSPSVSPSASANPGYTPGSDVAAHAAIGQDVAKIKTLLDAAKQAHPVDFTGVSEVFDQGGASKKGDGSTRTLAGLGSTPGALTPIRDAISGTGTSAGASEAVRAQRIDKGITVLLADKVIAELDAAATKVQDADLAPDSGAPHNVDEAWAFFTADGNGPATTADKRAADFSRQGKVREPIIAALTAAQAAAGRGDATALAAAATSTRQGLDYLFYLATFKYLGSSDEIGRAEGAAFYRGIQPRVAAADNAADTTITAAYTSANAAAGRTALNSPTVLAALGIDSSEQVDATS